MKTQTLEGLKNHITRWVCMEISSHTQEAPEKIVLSEGLLKTINCSLQEMAEVAREEGIKELAIEINNNCLISELYGWKGIVDMSVDKLLNKPKE